MQQLDRQDPRAIGEFRLLGCLGQGGFGRVYLGRTPSGAFAAVKIAHAHLTQDPEFRERFRREVTAVRRVSGWFTAALIAADAEAERCWMATEFIPAPTLADVVAACGPLPPPAVWWIVRDIARALASIHRAGLLHRDLKPANVLLAGDGIKVIDFGIAKLRDLAGYTRPGLAVGTPGFMPPEQLDLATVGRQGDVYSLAATAVYAATGHAPHAGGWQHVWKRLADGADPDLGGLPPEFTALLSRCLAREPARRMSLAEVLAEVPQPLRAGPMPAGGHRDRAGDGHRVPSAPSAVLPSAVAAYLDSFARDVTPPGASGAGPHGTLVLPDLQATRRVRNSWCHPLTGRTPSSPALGGRNLYLTTSAGEVLALDAARGTLLWNVPAVRGRASPPGIFEGPGGTGGRVVVGGRGRVTALDGGSGAPHWTITVGGQIEGRPAVADGVVFVGSRDGDVLALRASSGERLWRYRTAGGAASAPAVGSGTVYVGDAAGRVHALRAVSGECLWRYSTGGAVESSPTPYGGSVYAGSADECVYALDEGSGALRWRHHTGGPVRSSPAVRAGSVYTGSSDGGVYALDTRHGGVRWRYRTGGAVRSSPVLCAGTVYVGSLDSHLYALHSDTGALRWRYRTGGWVVAPPAAGHGYVYLGSYDQHVYALDAVSGAGPAVHGR